MTGHSTGRASITVVGIHGGEVFGRAAIAAVSSAAVVVASPRHRAFVDLSPGQHVLELAGALHVTLDRVDEATAAGNAVCVLSSGDPGFFGIVRVLGERFGPNSLTVLPAPSSVSLAFASVGMSWDDAVIVSAHGRPVDAAVEAVQRFAKVAVLTAPLQPPELLGRLLIDAGCGPRRVVVATRLGEPEAGTIVTDLATLSAGQFDPMSVVLFLDPAQRPADEPGLTWGIAERAFEHRQGLITKAEVRAVALGKLALPRRGVLWDVGAGSGSVGIECARLAPGLRVYAIERNADDADRIRRNARTHGVAIDVVVGSAPEALSDLPRPDRVFIGGGGIDVLDRCLEQLTPGGVVVTTHVLVDRAGQAWTRLGNTVQIAVSRGVAIADGVRLQAENPVFVSWGPGAEATDR